MVDELATHEKFLAPNSISGVRFRFKVPRAIVFPTVGPAIECQLTNPSALVSSKGYSGVAGNIVEAQPWPGRKASAIRRKGR